MTVPTGAATNIAGGAATVGVQTQAVHGDVTVYQLASNASPAEKYRIGLNYLDGGMPAKAQELIGDAIMEGYDTSEALFHWMLALLSGRTFRQFSEEDFSRFRAARERLPQYTGDQWSNRLKVINHLLDSVETSEADLRLVIKELDALGVAQRDKIVRHLEMFLKGPIEDQIWARVLAQVEIKRMGRGRKDRVWMFFQPKPAVPRVRQPDPVTTTMTAWFWVTMATTLFMATAGYIGWLLLARGEIPALFAYLISVAGGYTCFVKGLEWRDRVERLRVKEEERRPPSPQAYAPQGGFADNVDKLFNRYFARYMPEGADRRAWLAATAGTRRYLRDEIVDVYREKRVDCEKVAWLIRYRIREVEQRWQDGTLWDYRDQLRTSAVTKLAFALGLVPLVLGGVWAIDGAIRANPLLAITAAVFLAGSGYVSAIGWLRIKLERRRFKAEYAESQQRLADSMAALDRWQKKLAPKPSDSKMATWLDCDRKYLMDQTMRHYKLAPSQVIAHAFASACVQQVVDACGLVADEDRVFEIRTKFAGPAHPLWKGGPARDVD